MRAREFRTFALVACASLAAACAGPAGPRGSALPSGSDAPEVRAGAEFMAGRMHELEGRLLEAAEAYVRAARHDPQPVRRQHG